MRAKTGIIGAVAVLSLFLMSCGSDSSSTQRIYEILVTNNTGGQPVTPPLIVAHNVGFSLFTPGQPASAGITLQAEDGDPSMAKAEADAGGAVASITGSDVILPGGSMSFDLALDGDDGGLLTVTAMLATTNDAFVAVAGAPLPASGSATFNAKTYDAGTEMNTELCAHIPGPPCGNGGVRAGGGEGSIQGHGGIKGNGDLTVADQGWTEPAVTVTVTRK